MVRNLEILYKLRVKELSRAFKVFVTHMSPWVLYLFTTFRVRSFGTYLADAWLSTEKQRHVFSTLQKYMIYLVR